VTESAVISSGFPEQYSRINDPVWKQVSASARPYFIPAGTVINAGDGNSPGFMVLSAGAVRVMATSEEGREILLYRIRPGDVCVLALAELIDQRPGGIKAIIEQDVSAISMSHEQFQYAFSGSNDFRNIMLLTIARRLNEMTTLIKDLAFERLDRRIARTLLEKVEETGSTVLQLTHQDLAHHLGSTREVISRILKEHEKVCGCIRMGRGIIEIVDLDAIRAVAE